MSKQKPSQKTPDQPISLETIIVGIGASAGGVEALTQFFKQVTPHSGLAYVVILHLSPDYDSQLTQILQGVASIPVSKVNERVRVVADHVYVIPPNKHLQMDDGHLTVLPNAQIEDRRAPVDIFFRTLAESHQERAIGVILSGTGANGSMGLKRIKERGGAVFVQNPGEAAFNEMPRHAIATNLVDDILPVTEIPARLIVYTQSRTTLTISGEAQPRVDGNEQALREVFTQLRLRTGQDFTNYKRPTMLRRLERRLHVHNLPDLPTYVTFLREHPEELQALLKDLLISVTNFFRDSLVFTTLEQQVMPLLTQAKTGDDSLRIWVAGCATGEEAYSLAMLCAERTLDVLDAPAVQIFATDLDETALVTAREGLYTLNDAADVSPERLLRFFTPEGEAYRIRPEIREMVLFAHHNILKDPPFSRLNLVSCRNLLIYLNQTAQQRALETFHFALNPGGYLLLGLAETTDGKSDLYVPLNREHHLFQSRSVATRVYPVPEISALIATNQKQMPQATLAPENPASGRLSYGELHHQVLEQYAPPSILVNEVFDILHLSERAGQYLQMGGGEPTKNLLQLIQTDLRLELRTAFYQAVQLQTPVVVPSLKVRLDGQNRTITLHVRPVLGEVDPARGFMLVVFEPMAAERSKRSRKKPPLEPKALQLEEELMRANAQLRLANEQHELQAEELKAANEELQAINEELRSSAEELETSKEELQSINEELTTINQELKIKVEEISLAGNNLQNLINTTDIATLFLDRSLRVNFFTPATRTIFNLIATDTGRPLSDITSRLNYAHWQADAEAVLATLQPIEREVSTTDGLVFMGRVLPYRTTDDRINGLVLTFVNITQRKKAEEANYFLASIVESSQDSVITVNFDGMITSWNQAAETLYGYTAREVIGQPLSLLTLPQDLTLVLSQNQKIKESQRVETYDTIRLHKDGRKMDLEVVLSPVKDATGQVIGVSTVARDITERKRAEQVDALKRDLLEHQTESLARTGSWEYNQQSGQFNWSEGMFKLFGLEQGTPITPDIYRVCAVEADWLVAERLVTRLHNSLEPFEEVLRIQVRGEVRTLKIIAMRMPDDSASSPRLLGVDWDITEQILAQQQLEQTAQNLQAVLDASPASIGLLKAVHDPTDADQVIDFKLVVGNQRLAEFFAVPLSRLLGQSADRFSTLLWGEQTLAILQQVYQQNKPHYDERRLATPQSERWLAVAVSRQDDGLVLTGLDITELKLTQAQQQYWLDELEQASQSAQLVAQLRDSLQERGELLRAASHDLRGQVGIIASATQLLGMAGSEADRSQIIQMIQRNIQQMTLLMTNLLDFARLEAGQEVSHLSHFDVAGLLTELVAGAQPLARERGLALKAAGPTRLDVNSDVVQVRRMAQNLLLNALKYTSAGSVTVSWQPLDSGWQFSVADTGPGLTDAMLSRLRNEESVGESERPSAKSSFRSVGEGIGLSIVKRLCALLGGSLTIDSQLGIGTHFTLRFMGTAASVNSETNGA